MKKTFKLFGIIALVAVIGFSMAGCASTSQETTTQPTSPQLNNEPKSIVITGFNLELKFQPDEMGAFLLWDWDRGGPAGDGASRNGDTLTIELKTNTDAGRVPWTGTGEYFLLFEVRPGINGGEYTRWVYQDWAIVAINKAVTTVKWSDFDYNEEG
jgi:hypothetical protein